VLYRGRIPACDLFCLSAWARGPQTDEQAAISACRRNSPRLNLAHPSTERQEPSITVDLDPTAGRTPRADKIATCRLPETLASFLFLPTSLRPAPAVAGGALMADVLAGDGKKQRRSSRGHGLPPSLLSFPFPLTPPALFPGPAPLEIQRPAMVAEVVVAAPPGAPSPASVFPTRESAPPSSGFATVPFGPIRMVATG
jgi:hypothetical protein